MVKAERRPLSLTRETLERSQLYSEALSIDLAAASDTTCFSWFIASQLYGGRIAEATAAKTYAVFAEEELLSPRAILAAGRDYLINPVMRRGGYVRYDNRKAEQILRACRTLIDDYDGLITALHAAASDPLDLEVRLQSIYGVGPVTANIFLRELRPFWTKADPAPLPVVAELGLVLGIDTAACDHKALPFVRLEAGLLRHRRQLEWRIKGPDASARV